jgi:2,4-dienoyl-CoA reductase (NADPH2)
VETGQGIEEIPADTIVMATGSKSVNDLADAIKSKNIPFNVIGDAGKIGMAFDAVHQGYKAGTNI